MLYLRSLYPLCVEARAIIEGFLSADSCRRQSRIQIGAANGLFFGHAFPEKDGEAADEGIAGTGAVNAIDLESREVLATLAAAQERPVGSQGDDHACNAAAQQLLCALSRFVYCRDGCSRDGLGLVLVGNEIV